MYLAQKTALLFLKRKIRNSCVRCAFKLLQEKRLNQTVNLKSVVVEVGPKEHHEGFLKNLTTKFPDLRVVDNASLEHKYQNSFVRPSDLVPPLASATSMRNSFERIRDLLGISLFYVFDDGTAVEWNQIIYHPYAKSLHPDLLPLRKGIYEKNFAFEEYFWVRDQQKMSLEHGEVEYLFLRILKNLQKMIANRRLELYVSTYRNPDLSPVRFVRFEDQFQCTEEGVVKLHNQLESSDDTLSVDIGLEVKEGFDFYKNFYIDYEAGLFVFHRISGFFNAIETKLMEEGLVADDHFDYNQVIIPEDSLKFQVGSPEKALNLFHLLRSELSEKYKIKIGFEHERVVIAPEDVKGKLYFSKDGKLSVSFSFQLNEKDYEVFNYPNWIKPLLYGFDRGFRAAFDGLGWKFTPKGLRKGADNKIIKHLGLYYYFMYESLVYFTSGYNTDGKERELEEAYSFLFENLQKYFETSESGTENDGFGVICSKSLTELLRQYFDHLHQLSESHLRLLVVGKELSLNRMNQKYFRLLLETLNAAVISSNGDCFVKSRTNFSCYEFENREEDKYYSPQSYELKVLSSKNLSNVDRYSLASKGLKRSIILSEMFGLTRLGWQVYVDGIDVDVIDESDFQWQFDLEEKANEDGEALAGKQKIDWFELHPKFFLKGNEIDFEAARMLSQGEWIQYKGKYYILGNRDLPSVKILEKFWDRIANKQIKRSVKINEKPYFELEKSMSLELLALRSLGVDIKGGEEWNRISAFFDQLQDEDRKANLTEALDKLLKPYQKKGLRWLQDLYELRLGGVLADDMGLGKTLQTLAFMDQLQEEDNLGKVLILVPTSLVYNWMSEAKRFTPNLKFVNFNSKEKAAISQELNKNKHCVLISTYGLFTEHEEYFHEFNWNIHIFDEAQNLKNIVTKRTTAARRLKATFKLCLTGTPLENHLGEFYSLMDLCVPGSLGPYDEFKKVYVNPYAIDKEDIRFLKLKARPLVLRRTKKEILTELPDKTISVMKIPFTEEQQKIYRDVALSWNEKVKASINEVGEAKSQMIMLTALLRLRQVCSDPSALPGVNYKEKPPKIQLLIDNLEGITETGESAIVFTQFIHSLERIVSSLQKKGIKVFTMDGRSSKVKREETLKSFEHCDEGSVLVMTLKTGGVGLNLTKASYVFHLEPWWNPAVEDQATDRVHRLGQKKAVQVYRYIMEESVEEKIEQLKARKSSYFKSLFDNESPDIQEESLKKSGGLTKEDFEFLLS